MTVDIRIRDRKTREVQYRAVDISIDEVWKRIGGV